MPTSHNPYAPHSKVSEPAVTVEESANDVEPQGDNTAPLRATSGSENLVPDGPAAEVLEWVGDDKDRAKTALEAEEAGQQRVGLTKKLKELAE